eukprot:symbB.v1.2.008471.t1/scaffold534.1/size190675/2
MEPRVHCSAKTGFFRSTFLQPKGWFCHGSTTRQERPPIIFWGPPAVSFRRSGQDAENSKLGKVEMTIGTGLLPPIDARISGGAAGWRVSDLRFSKAA